MATRCGLFASLMLWSLSLSLDPRHELIVWNVGQGQWVTLIEQETCWHFDTGGEKAPWGQAKALCRDHFNRVTYSHWDWDHLSFARRFLTQLPNSCLQWPPIGRSSPHKEEVLKAWPHCSSPAPFDSWVDEHGRTSNDKSRVVWWERILIPGDSTAKEEKFWISAFPQLPQTKILVLGHHGSQSSTSALLLRHLTGLEAAVSSARQRKYGHPHWRVQKDLKAFGIPLLRTEEWGNLHFEL